MGVFVWEHICERSNALLVCAWVFSSFHPFFFCLWATKKFSPGTCGLLCVEFKLSDRRLHCFMQELEAGRLRWIWGQHVGNHCLLAFLHTGHGTENITTSPCACKRLRIAASTFSLVTRCCNHHHCRLLIYTDSHLLFQSQDQAGIIPCHRKTGAVLSQK